MVTNNRQLVTNNDIIYQMHFFSTYFLLFVTSSTHNGTKRHSVTVQAAPKYLIMVIW